MTLVNRLVIPFCLLCVFGCTFINGFNVGISGTKCSLNPNDGPNPCASLYNGICDGAHCKCPPGTVEDKSLKTCKKRNAPATSRGGSKDDDLFDLPYEYTPNKKDTPASGTTTKKKNESPIFPALPPPHQPQPGISYPQQPGAGGYPSPKQPSGGYPYNPNSYPKQPAPGYPKQPAPGYPTQPVAGYPKPPGAGYPSQPHYPQQPGGYPNQPQYPQQPGGYPNQPQYPQQPGGYPNQPQYPQQPGGYPRKPHGRGNKGDPHIGEKAGGGAGGVIGLLLLVGLIYFCCCRGEKGKNFMSKLPFGRRGANIGGPMQMQAASGVPQQTYMPTDQQYPQGPPQSAPPPYTQTYQPTAPYPA